MREHLSDERESVTHRFKIYDGVDWLSGHVNVGLYSDGRPGELFLRVGKPGTSNAMYDQWAIAISVALQFGADPRALMGKFRATRFEPSGATANPGIPRCTSPLDYVARWFIERFCPGEQEQL